MCCGHRKCADADIPCDPPQEQPIGGYGDPVLRIQDISPEVMLISVLV